MIANYGYTDGSGEYFIVIDTSHCEHCGDHPCLEACPEKIYAMIVNDYDETEVAVRCEVRNTLKYACAGCKPVQRVAPEPCIGACSAGAISHSW